MSVKLGQTKFSRKVYSVRVRLSNPASNYFDLIEVIVSFSKVITELFINFTDYDPFYVPIVYAEDNIEPTTTLEAEIKKQTEKQELENEARRQQEANTESDVLGQPDVDIRLGENENKNPTPDDDENRVIPQHQDYLTTSTTLRPTKRRPSKQDPICKLTPDPESDVGFNAGYRFGTVIDSRIEYAELPAKIRKSYDISLQFRTEKPNGTLFYAADSRHTDFIVLYLKDGHVSNIFLIIVFFFQLGNFKSSGHRSL